MNITHIRTIATGLGLGLGRRLVGCSQVKLDDLALTHGLNPFEAQGAKRAAHSLALHIKHSGLQHDGDTRFHGDRPFS